MNSRPWLLAACLLALTPTVPRADTIGCSTTQTAALEKAISAAAGFLNSAAVSVGDTADYRRWFGAYDSQRASVVRSNIETLQSHMLIGVVTAVCSANGTNDCEPGHFANVAPDEPYKIYICEGFFELPTFPIHPPLSMENGTQEGTIVHEMTHFDVTNATDDHCYSRSNCEAFAQANPDHAIRNADSYQYFSEDAAANSF